VKILAFSDIHGNIYQAKKIASLCNEKNIKTVIIAGDLTYFGKIKDIFSPFLDNGVKRLIIIPGNHEEPKLIKKYIEKNFGNELIFLEGDFFVLKDYLFIGFSANNIFPTTTIYSEEEAFKILENVFNKAHKHLKNKKLITISHIHPEEFIDKIFPFPGSKAWRFFIKKYKPLLHLHGHIHEGEGISYKIGETLVINLGERGKIIDLKKLKR
jgi:Icc-related predicted phosphoesterase